MRGRRFVAGILVTAGLAGCGGHSVRPAPPPPAVTASPASPYEPEAFLAIARAAVDEAGVGDDVAQSDVESGEVSYRPCELFVTDPRSGDPEVSVDAVWAGQIEVNAVPSFQAVARPTTVVTVEVARLTDAATAGAAADRLRAARCPGGDFRLRMGLATARQAAATVTVGATGARVTTATVRRVDPESEAGMTYLPGDARLFFAYGPLLVSVEALALWPRHGNTAAEITAMAQEKATTVAAAIVARLPPGDATDPGPGDD
ncbi:hypothetical protein [Micromonospora costi]|uniref:hypothetical protein n=1 Tax=Micromonospora costi TaxID=1530042 RepID=UPI001F4EB1CE|nr:hypothetical protein [Micromonospora costi]